MSEDHHGIEARASGFDDTEIMLSNDSPSITIEAVATLKAELQSDESVFAGLGYGFEDAEEGSRVKVPSARSLNSSLRAVGLHDRRVVDFEGASISSEEYLRIIAEGGIPAAIDPAFRLHDLISHGLGFMLLPPRAMGIVQGMAAEALHRGDMLGMNATTSYIDTLTAYFNESKDTRLVDLYGKHMNKISAGILAKKDMRTVKKTMHAIARKNSRHTSQMSSAQVVGDSDSSPW